MTRGVLLIVCLLGCSQDPLLRGDLAILSPLPAPRLLAYSTRGRDVANACVDTSALLDHSRLDALIPALLAEHGLEQPQDRHCDWRLHFSRDPRLLGAEDAAIYDAAVGVERFAVHTDGSATSVLIAETEREALYALRSALDLAVRVDGVAQVPAATLVDYPDMPIRGIIEGFYGPPYSSEERLSVISRMDILRQNRFLYAPQNDDHAHDKWADPYPDDIAQSLQQAAAAAQSKLIDFVWGVRLGVNIFGYSQPEHSIRFSSDDDFSRLTAKLDSLRELGIHKFALLVDDSQPQLYWPEDAQRFPDIASAHAFLANRLQAYIASSDPDARLVFVGTKYTASLEGWQDYNAKLGAALDAAIEVLWTGNDVYSDTIEPSDLVAINDLLHRRVVIWDNAPTYVSGLYGRANDLHSAVSGFMSNAVLNEWHKRPVTAFHSVMGPIGVFSWNAANYDPGLALEWWSPGLGVDL